MAIDRRKIIKGEFISLVYKSYRYLYIAKITGILSFFVVVDYILLVYPHLSQNLSILIRPWELYEISK